MWFSIKLRGECLGSFDGVSMFSTKWELNISRVGFDGIIMFGRFL